MRAWCIFGRQLGAALCAVLLLAWQTPLHAQSAQEREDAGFVANFLQDQLSSVGREVRIIGFAGALSSRATIEELSIADDDGVWLILRGAVLDWNRSALLRRRVEINELAAEEIIIVRRPRPVPEEVSPEAVEFRLPELPVSLRVGRVDAARVEIGADVLGAAAVVTLEGSAQLAGGAGETDLNITRIDGEEGALRLAGEYDNATRMLTLDLSLQEAENGIAANLLALPGRPALDLDIAGTGQLSDFAADIVLATDGVTRLVGQVALASPVGVLPPRTDFRAQLGGDLAVLLAPEFQSFFGDGINLVAEGTRFGDGRLEIGFLDLAAEKIALTGQFRLGADGLPELMLLDGRIAAEDGSAVLLPVPGPRTRVEEVTLSLDFDAERGEDWRTAFEMRGIARPDLTLESLGLEGAGRITRGDVQGLDARLRFAADGLRMADAALADALGTAVTGFVNLGWEPGTPLVLPSFGLSGEDFSLTGAGQIDGQRIAGRAEARLDSLGRFSALAGRPLSGGLTGVVVGEGEVLSGIFDVVARVTGRDLQLDQPEIDRLLAGVSQITASLRRDTEGTTIRSITAEARALSASVRGTLRTDATLIDADLEFSDLSVLGAEYGGALSAVARVVEDAQGQRLEATATGRDLVTGVAEIDNLLRGTSEVEVTATRRDDLIGIERFRLAASTLSVQAEGQIAEGVASLDAVLDFPDLSVLGAEYGGALSAVARVVGDAQGQRLEATATGRDLATGVAEIDNLLRGTSEVEVTATRRDDLIGIERFRLAASTLSVQAEGQIAEGVASLDAVLDFPDLSVLGPRYAGRVSAEGTLREADGTRNIVLRAEARNLSVAQREADILLGGDTSLELRASETDGRVRIDHFALENPQITANASGVIDDSTRRVLISARLANLAQLASGFAGPVTVEGSLEEVAAGYTLDLTGQGPGNLSALASGTVAADFATLNVGLTGSADLALVNQGIDPISVQGTSQFDLRIDGPPALSSLSGRVTTAGAQVVSPRQAITLSDVTMTATLAGGRAQVDGRGAMNGGTIGIAGGVALAAPFVADLRATISNVQLSDDRIYETQVSGVVNIDGPLASGGRISGALQLADTEIRIPSTGLGGSGYIPPLRHINEPAAVRATRERAGLTEGRGDGKPRVPWALDLTVSAPNRVFVRGRGLDAELGGTLVLTGTTAQVIPSGEFSLIRGRLDLLGRRFTLSEGFARLQGRFVPFIRLVASTNANGLSASIILSGEADALEINFESTPDLPDEEILSRLLFGQDLGRLTAFQAAQLASAVATLAGRGGEGIVGNLRRSFGLDDLDIATDTDGNAALRLGKYLTEQVYTDIIVDSTGKSEVSINLDVSPSVTIRARTDSEGRSGLGVFFERDY